MVLDLMVSQMDSSTCTPQCFDSSIGANGEPCTIRSGSGGLRRNSSIYGLSQPFLLVEVRLYSGFGESTLPVAKGA
jgi:hypothetical protein